MSTLLRARRLVTLSEQIQSVRVCNTPLRLGEGIDVCLSVRCVLVVRSGFFLFVAS